MKIQMGKCGTCGSMAYLAEVAGLRAVVGPWPVTPDPWGLIQGKFYVLLDGPRGKVLRVATLDDQAKGVPILADHEHRGAVRPVEAPAAPPACPAPNPTPSGPQTGSQAPSWRLDEDASRRPFGATVVAAPAATPPPSRPTPPPTCEDCHQPCLPGTYWAIEHAGAVLYAQHAEPCS